VRLNLAENGPKALKVIRLKLLQKKVNDAKGDLTDAQIKDKLTATQPNGGYAQTIAGGAAAWSTD